MCHLQNLTISASPSLTIAALVLAIKFRPSAIQDASSTTSYKYIKRRTAKLLGRFWSNIWDWNICRNLIPVSWDFGPSIWNWKEGKAQFEMGHGCQRVKTRQCYTSWHTYGQANSSAGEGQFTARACSGVSHSHANIKHWDCNDFEETFSFKTNGKYHTERSKETQIFLHKKAKLLKESLHV